MGYFLKNPKISGARCAMHRRTKAHLAATLYRLKNPTAKGWRRYCRDAGSVHWNAPAQRRKQRAVKNERPSVLLLPTELAVDDNRDGTIVMANDAGNPANVDSHGNPLPVDTTSQTHPYRFWLNDNEDVPVDDPTFDDVTPETVPPNPSWLDWMQDYVASARDLEDWTRLWIYTKGLNQAIHDGTIQVGLKWSSTNGTTPGIKIITASDTDGGLEYIQKVANGNTQASGDPNDPNGSGGPPPTTSRFVVRDGNDSHTNIVPTGNVADFVFPQWVWHGLSDANPKSFFLFEGTTEGTGQLQIVFLKKNGTTETLLGTGGNLWLNLMQIKKMYDRGHAAPTEDHFPFPYNVSPTSPGAPYINTAGSLSVSPAMTCQPGDYKVPGADTGLSDNGSPTDPQTNPTLAAPDEASQLIVFVHGITVTCDNFTSYSQSMYKRLWWSGYKGRFAAFQWTTPSFPTITGAVTDVATTTALFNNGEYQAWNCGPALAAFVASEKASVQAHDGSAPTVGIAAHSLGNVVANSAYNSAMHSDYYCALNAAISLSCFFPSQNTTGDPTAILSDDTLHPAFDANLINAETPGTPLPLLGGLVDYYGSHTPDVYRGSCTVTLNNVTTKITNYHNQFDYWLQTGYVFGFVPVNWQQDQYFMKPTVFSYGFNQSGVLPPSYLNTESKLYGWNLAGQAAGCGYRDDIYGPTLDPSGNPLPPSLISSIHRPVNDPMEQMSYVARSKTDALGAQSDAGWAGLQGGAAQIDLIAQYGFTSAQNDHSGAFNRNIQQLSDTTTFGAAIPFYDQLRLDLTGHNQENP